MSTPRKARRKAGFATFGVLVACALPATAAAKAPPKGGIGTAVVSVTKLAPPWLCTIDNLHEIFVDEDRIMYACECEKLTGGHICRWQVIGGVDARKMRRFAQQHRLIVFLRPAVTA